MPGLLAGFLYKGVGRFLGRGSSGAAGSGGLPVIPSQGAQAFVNKAAANLVHPWLSVSSVSNIRSDVR